MEVAGAVIVGVVFLAALWGGADSEPDISFWELLGALVGVLALMVAGAWFVWTF